MKIVHIADIHVNHPKVNPLSMSCAFMRHVLPELQDADFLVIAGDYFDSMLHFNSRESAELAYRIFNSFVAVREKNPKLKVRLLRGTFTHDRNQCELLQAVWYRQTVTKTSIDALLGADDSIRYVDQVTIVPETIDGQTFYILYLPDSLSQYKDSYEVMDVVQEHMQHLKIDKVDFVVGHGYFEHRLPKGALHQPKIVYTYDQFRRIVKHKVLMGHIHVHSSFRDFIYYSGSIERLNHGEEEDKGFYVHEGSLDEGFTSRFVVNNYSTLFLTVEVPDEITDVSNAVLFVYEFIKEHFYKNELHGYLRIKSSDTHFTELIAEGIKQKVPQDTINVSVYRNKIKNELTTDMNSIAFDSIVVVCPNVENLASLITNHLKETNRINFLQYEDIDAVVKSVFPDD